jgi:hypothetical protein
LAASPYPSETDEPILLNIFIFKDGFAEKVDEVGEGEDVLGIDL